MKHDSHFYRGVLDKKVQYFVDSHKSTLMVELQLKTISFKNSVLPTHNLRIFRVSKTIKVNISVTIIFFSEI